MGQARCLAGTIVAFSAVKMFARHADRIELWRMELRDLDEWIEALSSEQANRVNGIVSRLQKPHEGWAGLLLKTPALMGIVNVTPDSFSDGGLALAAEDALARIDALARDGAAIVDIGAESTRPGSRAVDEAEELRRLRPLFDRIDASRTILSIDTRKATIMRAAIDAGFRIMNDVSALTDDPRALETVAASDAHVVLMHKQGEPETMNDAPAYAHPLLDVYDFLEARIEACEAAAIPRSRIAVDPGIGFGKGSIENRTLLLGLALFHGLGCPVLIGVSRKSFSRAMEEAYAPKDRLPGTLAALVLAAERGAHILRVHDVAAVRQAMEAWAAIVGPN